jgi:hypothetical protein
MREVSVLSSTHVEFKALQTRGAAWMSGVCYDTPLSVLLVNIRFGQNERSIMADSTSVGPRVYK